MPLILYGRIFAAAGAFVNESRTVGRLYRSTDNGSIWQQVYQAIGQKFLYCLTITPNGDLFIGGSYPEVDKGFVDGSTDGGDNWNQNILIPMAGPVYALSYDIFGYVYAASRQNKIFSFLNVNASYSTIWQIIKCPNGYY